MVQAWTWRENGVEKQIFKILRKWLIPSSRCEKGEKKQWHLKVPWPSSYHPRNLDMTTVNLIKTIQMGLSRTSHKNQIIPILPDNPSGCPTTSALESLLYSFPSHIFPLGPTFYCVFRGLGLFPFPRLLTLFSAFLGGQKAFNSHTHKAEI